MNRGIGLVKDQTVRYGQKMLDAIKTDAGEIGKSEARRRAILDVARELFLAQGFAATSMSEIAVRLGGSKGTLYNYFRSKEELFAAIMIDTCQGPANAVFGHMPSTDGDLRTALIELGSNLLNFILSAPSMTVHRVVVAESGRFPELGRIFYEAGPKMGQIKLEAFFKPVIESGRLTTCEPLVAARRFKDLVLSDVYSRRLWGVIDDLTPEQLHEHIAESVDIFLAAFAPSE
jgi:AcrR family transcriptional regulator